jgi:hypothetical protein
MAQRTYFAPVMVAYIAGLVTAFAANSITHLGQVTSCKTFAMCYWLKTLVAGHEEHATQHLQLEVELLKSFSCALALGQSCHAAYRMRHVLDHYRCRWAFCKGALATRPQPALLYIVPAILGAVLVTGASRGELTRMWSFTDVPSFGVATASEHDGKQRL